MAAALLQYQACLGIMIRLQVEDLNLLKQDFDRMGRGLSLREFVSAMLDRVSWEVENVVPFIEDLVELFAQVDVNGDGTMEWEEFTSAIIEGGMGTSSEETEWRDMKYEENPRFADLLNRPPKRIQFMQDFRRLLLYENTRPVVEIIDPTTLFSNDADTNVTNHGGLSDNTESNDAEEPSSTPRGGNDTLFTPTLSIVNNFHPLCYIPGYRRDQDEVRSERSPVQALKYLSVVELLAVSAGDLKLTFWATTILTATSTSALETPVPLAVVHTPRPQRVLEWNAPTRHLFSISADLVISVWLVEREKKHDSKGRCEVTPIATLKKHTDLLQDLLVLNAETLVSCGMDSMIYLWDTLSLKPKAVRQGHRRGVRMLTKLSSHLFISAGFECEVLGWDISALATTPVFKLWGHTSPVCCIQLITSAAFASQTERLINAAQSSTSAAAAAATALLADQAITVDDEGWFKWWNLANVLSMESNDLEKSNSRCLQTFRVGVEKYPWKAHSLAVLNNGQSILAAGMHKLKLFQRVRLKPKVLESSVVLYNSVSYTLLTTTDKEIRIWDASSGALIRTYGSITTSDITCVDLDARQRKIVFGTQNGELVVLNYLNGAILKHWTPHQLHVSAIVYCKEDQCVLTASWDRSLRLYDDNASSNALLRCITEAHDADIKCLAYCYALSLFASGSTDGTIKIWDYIYFLLEDTCSSISESVRGSSAAVASHSMVQADVNALEFIEPYPLLLSGHENGMVCIWALGSMQKSTTLLVCFRPTVATPLTATPSPSKDSQDHNDSSYEKNEGISCCQVFYDEEGGELMANDIRRGRFLVLCGDNHGTVCVSDISQVITKSSVRAFREESLPSSHLRSYNPRRRFLRQGKNAKRLRGKHSTGNSSNGSARHISTDDVGNGTTPHQNSLQIEAADIQRVAWWRAHKGGIRCLRTVEEPRGILTCGSDKKVKVWAFDGTCLGNLAPSVAGGSTGGPTSTSTGDSITGDSSAWKWELDLQPAAQAKREQAEAIWNEMKATKLKNMGARHQSVVELRRKRRKSTAVELSASKSAPTLGMSVFCRSHATDGASEGAQQESNNEATRLFEQLNGKTTWKQSDFQVARQAAWELERSKFQHRMQKIMMAKKTGDARNDDSFSKHSQSESNRALSLPGNQEHAEQEGESGLGELIKTADFDQADDVNLLPALEKSVQELPYHDKDNWSVGSLNREKQMYSNLHHENVRRSQASLSTNVSAGSASHLPRYPRNSGERIDLAPSSFLLEKLGASCMIVENLPPRAKTKTMKMKTSMSLRQKRLEGTNHTQSAPTLSTAATASIQQLRSNTLHSTLKLSGKDSEGDDNNAASGALSAPHHSIQDLIRQYDQLMQDPPMEEEVERNRRTTKLFDAMPRNVARRRSADSNLKQQQEGQQHVLELDLANRSSSSEILQQTHLKKVSSAPSNRQKSRSPSDRPISSAKAKSKMNSNEAKKAKEPEIETTAAKKLRMRSDAALLRQERFGSHSRDDIVNIYRTFQKLDKDQSGTITLRELRDGAGIFSGSGLQDNIMSIFSSVDKDQSGHIDLQELLGAIFGGDTDQPNVLPDIFRFCELLECAEKAKKSKRRQLSPEQLKELFALFKLYDLDHDGNIDADELFSALQYNDKFYDSGSRSESAQLTLEDVQKVIAHFDVNTNATLDIDEFIELFREDS